MLKTMNEVQSAIIGQIDACEAAGIDTKSPAAKAWYAKDAKTLKLMKLFHLYNHAKEEALSHGYIGVGCITYAENKLQAAQV